MTQKKKGWVFALKKVVDFKSFGDIFIVKSYVWRASIGILPTNWINWKDDFSRWSLQTVEREVDAVWDCRVVVPL